MLPNVDGYTLCRQIRNRYPALPVIFLTAKVETADLVKGFEAGGTDYMRKPFSIEELIVRIHNQLNLLKKKNESEFTAAETIEIGKYVFSPARSELKTPTRTIKLSLRELQVLNLLISRINSIADRKELLMTVWGDDSFFNSRTLDVYIRKLRDYFAEDPGIEIVTMKGKGYLFLIK
jgi:DNA-binding response OmpR family regulator